MPHLDERKPLHLSSIWSLDKLYTKVVKPFACLIHIVHMESNVSIPVSRSPPLTDCCTHRLQVMLAAQEQETQLQTRADHLKGKQDSMQDTEAIEQHHEKSPDSLSRVQRENCSEVQRTLQLLVMLGTYPCGSSLPLCTLKLGSFSEPQLCVNSRQAFLVNIHSI